MAAVMDSPTIGATFCNGELCAFAAHIIQPDQTLSFTKFGTVCPRYAFLEAQLSAHHIGKIEIHFVVTHSAPCTIV